MTRASVAVATAASLIVGCSHRAEPSTSASQSAPSGSKAAPLGNPAERRVFFGDLHVHTMYSFDAFVFGTRATPDDAYRYARGEALMHPSGFEMKLDQPLDFLAVTDHAEFLGVTPAMADPDSAASGHPLAPQLRAARSPRERVAAFRAFAEIAQGGKGHELQHPEIVRSAWRDIIGAAHRHYRPGEFTTFIGYEYSSSPSAQNLHRNVIFRGERAPEQPFSLLDSENPEDLWDWMDQLRRQGIEALAIPHNSNASNGQMFKIVDWAGDPLGDVRAIQRLRNEPLVEITQVKGTSETHPELSPNDEWANFEIMPFRISSPLPNAVSGGYAREALLRGLAREAGGARNPFRFGFIGSSDTHVGAAALDEDNYWGKVGAVDGTGQLRGVVPIGTTEAGAPEYSAGPFHRWGASGLAGVWAEHNSRDAIFDALARKETFATSGPRIRVRLFASQDYPDDIAARPDAVALAYAGGVPMGGNVHVRKPPEFLAWALRDPANAPLQRLQIVKGWVDTSGRPQERIYDIACSDGLAVDRKTHRCPDNGARVNLADCSISADRGAAELKTLWRDPDHAASQVAFYYLRALENPTCRWSTWDALRARVRPRTDVPATIQERAWTSPIWVRPSGAP